LAFAAAQLRNPGEWVNLVTPHLKNSQLVKFPFTGHAVLPKIDMRAIDHDRVPRQPDAAGRPHLRGEDHAVMTATEAAGN